MRNISVNDITPVLLSVCRRSFVRGHYAPQSKYTYTYRMLFVSSGVLRLETESGSLEVAAGGLLLIPPGVVYKTVFESGQVKLCHLFYDIYAPRSASEAAYFPPGGVFKTGLSDVVPSERVNLVDAAMLNMPTVINGIRHLQERFDRLISEYGVKQPCSRLRLNAALAELIADAVTCTDADGAGRDARSPAAGLILGYVAGHYREKLTCAGIAEKFHYHPNYVAWLIRRETGMTVRRYISSLRISEAVRLLDETDMSVTEISQSLGFCDSSHFCNVYRSLTGGTPHERRQFAI